MTSTEKEAFLPSSAEVELAKVSFVKLDKVLSERKSSDQVSCTLVINNGVEIDITPSAAQALLEVVNVISHGKAVVVNSIDKVMETQEAADFLNISRPFLCKLLDSGEIPHHMVGRFRRVKYEDLLAYKSRRITKQNQAMDELAAQAQELNMGY
ncbi:MAG: helix-turn-helix domain-containing protein [Cyanobacteria bacterium REEB67]|nr:helix-turn-helix domain-containing protein [Cyanobacteria bacterium REEB67]